jgi:tetratricopeptide (TPR) repeat protein
MMVVKITPEKALLAIKQVSPLVLRIVVPTVVLPLTLSTAFAADEQAPAQPALLIQEAIFTQTAVPRQATTVELLTDSSEVNFAQSAVPTARPTLEETEDALQRQRQQKLARSYDLPTLKSDAVLFSKYLNQALATGDMATVKQLLPDYKALANNDPTLIQYAEALIYRSEGDNKAAIAIYRKMLATDPNFHPVRLNLATALYVDKQYVAAKSQYLRLRAEPLPEPILASIERSLQQLKRVDEWRFNTSISYISDDNVNDVPGDYSVAPIKANGLQATIGAKKRINLPKNYYATVGGNAFIKGYWDESDYNDYLFTVSTGAGYADAKNDISLSPYMSKRYYNEADYSLSKGISVRASRWVKPKLKLTLSSRYSNEKFEQKKDKNRETDGKFIGASGLYTKNATEYYYGGVDHYRNEVPKSSIISYERNGVNVGWGKEWSRGISTLTTVGYAIKDYDNPSETYRPGSGGYIGYYNSFGGEYGSNRKDKTTSLGLQVWKRDFTLYGLTPRLVMNYAKTSSNFRYYDNRDEKSATVLLTKSF